MYQKMIHPFKHNPVGRVWKKEELKQVLKICKKYEVKVIADEIHQDIIIGENKQHSIIKFEEYNYRVLL